MEAPTGLGFWGLGSWTSGFWGLGFSFGFGVASGVGVLGRRGLGLTLGIHHDPKPSDTLKHLACAGSGVLSPVKSHSPCKP